jgi:hypothetical protein
LPPFAPSSRMYSRNAACSCALVGLGMRDRA